MKTKGLRLYGVNDLRLDEFELPRIKEDEILARVITDSICMSSYKAAIQGAGHKRVPKDIAKNPVIIGHEMCGEILEVGKKYKGRYKKGQLFTMQTSLNHPSNIYAAPGYSFRYTGGTIQNMIVAKEVMEMDCLLEYNGDSYYQGSLAEPYSCIAGAFAAMYHTNRVNYEHTMGIKEGGKMAILAGAGPMGLGAIDYAVNQKKKPSLLVITDIDDARLARAAEIFSPEWAAEHGVKLVYLNTGKEEDPVRALMELSDNKGYDDVFVFAPVKPVVEQGDRILGYDGCLNFFAGPSDTTFSASFNFYNVHYNSTHVVGTSGGNTEDMKECITMFEEGKLNPAAMVTHIGGLDSAAETTLNLPDIPGGKKLIYTGISMPLTAISEFKEKGYPELANICDANKGLWCKQAEDWLLKHSKKI